MKNLHYLVGMLAVSAHDASKCLDDGKFDENCCGAMGYTACGDDYLYKVTDKTCKDTPYKAYYYTCESPISAKSDFVPRVHDPTKCRDKYQRLDNDCCAAKNDANCADDYFKE